MAKIFEQEIHKRGYPKANKHVKSQQRNHIKTVIRYKYVLTSMVKMETKQF